MCYGLITNNYVVHHLLFSFKPILLVRPNKNFEISKKDLNLSLCYLILRNQQRFALNTKGETNRHIGNIARDRKRAQ